MWWLLQLTWMASLCRQDVNLSHLPSPAPDKLLPPRNGSADVFFWFLLLPLLPLGM